MPVAVGVASGGGAEAIGEYSGTPAEDGAGDVEGEAAGVAADAAAGNAPEEEKGEESALDPAGTVWPPPELIRTAPNGYCPVAAATEEGERLGMSLCAAALGAPPTAEAFCRAAKNAAKASDFTESRAADAAAAVLAGAGAGTPPALLPLANAIAAAPKLSFVFALFAVAALRIVEPVTLTLGGELTGSTEELLRMVDPVPLIMGCAALLIDPVMLSRGGVLVGWRCRRDPATRVAGGDADRPEPLPPAAAAGGDAAVPAPAVVAVACCVLDASVESACSPLRVVGV